jgi:hypothetical protein
MHSKILATRIIDDKKIAKCIKCVASTIIEFRMSQNLNIYVTDNASNMKAAFKDHFWMGYSCHNLNLVLSNWLQQKKR